MAFLLAKYNTQTTFRFPIVKRAVVDLAASGDWTPATGDTKISKDGGNFANTTNNPSATGGTGSVGWTLTLTATELSAAEINVQIVDSATKAIEDQWLTIYTYGNASAKIIPDLSDSVRMGLTALPNAAAEAAGGLYTRGTGAGQINQANNGQIDANAVRLGGTTQTGRDIGASVLLSAGTGTGQLDFTSGVVKSNLVQILATALTETAGQIAAAFKKWFDVATPTGTVNSIPNATAGAAGGLFIAGTNAATTITTALTTTFTGNLTGSVGSVTGAVGSVTGNVGGNVTGSVGNVTGAVGSVTGNVGGNVTGTIGGLTAAALKDFFDTDSTTTYGAAVSGSVVKEIADNAGGSSLTATAIADEVETRTIAAVTTVGSVTGAVGSVTGNVGGNVAGSVNSVTSSVTVGTNNDKTGYTLSNTGIDALFTRALTEAYATLGAAPTLSQLLFEVRALLAEKAVASTTLTTKKLNGTDTAATYTLDDAVAPTSITRAS